jgi:DNA-binding GntR family transcriptional regulator
MGSPLTVPSLIDALADSLRERILTGQITGGTAITETNIAREYEVARPTAKVAIERLVAAGLLHRSRNKSARVPEIGPEDIRDVYLARAYLESMAAKSLCLSGAVPSSAERAIDELSRTPPPGHLRDLVAADVRFHRSLVDAVGSPRVSRMHAEIMAEIQLSMAQVQSQRLLERDIIVADHQDIVDKIRSRDPEAASAAVLNHLDHACGALTRHFQPKLSETNLVAKSPAGLATVVKPATRSSDASSES